jgi:hypothetical protein
MEAPEHKQSRVTLMVAALACVAVTASIALRDMWR